MGAEAFILKRDATNPRDAFYELVEEAKKEYGDRPYNGTISTCSLGRQVARYERCTKQVIDDAMARIDRAGNGEKWIADYIDCGICGSVEYKQVISKVDNISSRIGYSVWVEPKRGNRYSIDKVKTKTEALARLNAQRIRAMCNLDIDIVVRVGDAGDEVARLHYVVNRNSKRALRSKGGLFKVVPLHTYLFFGFAST